MIDISEETSTKSCMDYAWVLVGCENMTEIPRQFTAVIGEQLCAIKIEVKCSWGGVPREAAPPTTKEGLDVTATPASVGDMGTSEVGLVGSPDRSFAGVALHPAGNRCSYMEKSGE